MMYSARQEALKELMRKYWEGNVICQTLKGCFAEMNVLSVCKSVYSAALDHV